MSSQPSRQAPSAPSKQERTPAEAWQERLDNSNLTPEQKKEATEVLVKLIRRRRENQERMGMLQPSEEMQQN